MHNIQLVKIQPEERLAASSELNPASCLVTGCGEARGMGYWAATQVKGLSPEIFIVPEADVVVLTEGSTLIADSPIGTWQGDASPAGSETVARYQTDIMGTRETQSVLLTGVCAIKPINGKTVQTTLWESDQFIVPVKQGNACRGKGLAGARWPGRGTPSILRDGQGVSTKLWSITLRERRGCTPEEPDEGKLQVRFCEGAHSNLGAITSKKRCAMGSTRQKEGTNKYRLPSEAEWEYACRAGTTTRFSFGDDDSKLGEYAWYSKNSGDKTHPVGQKKPNPWGLYDICGNVREWVQDVWHVDYNGAPTDGSVWEAGGGTFRVFRGGGMKSISVYCRSANRGGGDQDIYIHTDLGFRIVKEE